MLKKTSKGLGKFSSLLLLGAASAAALSVSPASAADVETVVVTGSRIPRSDFVAESPVTVVTADTIAVSGNFDLGEVLRQNLGVGGGGGGSFGQSDNLSGGGATSVDLRDLGSDRVLNLINGKRVASFADSLQNEAADLGFIPMAMVERVEVLRDGASAVYGADAVSGVINVILKKDYEGMEVSAQIGRSEYGDRDQWSLQTVIGGNFNRGNIVLSAEYNYQAGVPQQRRPWAQKAISSLSSSSYTVGSGAHPGGLYYFYDETTGDFSGYWCTEPKAFGGDEVTDVFGTSACPSTPSTSKENGPNARYDYALVQSILNQTRTINLAEYATYKITDDIEAFVESEISTRKSSQVLDGNPIFAGSGSPSFPDGWIVPASNPYNPYPGSMAYVSIRPTSTIGPRNNYIDADMLRIVSGLRGEKLFDRFTWEVSYMYTQVTGKVTTDATFNLARAIRISDPDACAADAVCSAALNPLGLGALDVYRPGNWSQSEIDYMKQIATSNSFFTTEGVYSNIGGDIVDLWAGPIAFSAGFEYRRESVEFRPDAVTAGGESVANQTYPTEGSFTVREYYGELNIPVVNKMFLMEDVSLNLQGRVFDYSTFGSGTVYKAGLNWVFTDYLRGRATYGTSFRAPTLVDTFSGGTVSFDYIDDPCDMNNPELAGNAIRQANCLAAGADPATFTQSAAQLPVLSGGDIVDGTFDLQPEKAKTWTIGLVFTPEEMIPGLRASVDFWEIHVSNFITDVDTEAEVLDPCYDSAGFSSPMCATVQRNPATHQLTGLTSFPINYSDTIKTNGIDWGVAYTFDLYGGTASLNNVGTWKLGYNLYPGRGNCGSSSGNCIPLVEDTMAVDYEIDEWTFTWRTHYISAMHNIQVVEPNALNYTGPGDYFMHDARVSYDLFESTRLTFGVNNVLNTDPPYVFSTGNNTNPYLYGEAVVGRYYFMRIKTKL